MLACTTLVQFLSRIVTHLLLSVVDSRRFYDNRQVTSWSDRQGMAHDLVSKVLGVFFMQTETVVFFVAVPLFQFDDKVNRLRILDALNTEQRLDIDDADATKLDEMTRDIRRRADQSDVTDFTQLYNIIAYQTVSTLDQLQCSLTLADAALLL